MNQLSLLKALKVGTERSVGAEINFPNDQHAGPDIQAILIKKNALPLHGPQSHSPKPAQIDDFEVVSVEINKGSDYLSSYLCEIDLNIYVTLSIELVT